MSNLTLSKRIIIGYVMVTAAFLFAAGLAATQLGGLIETVEAGAQTESVLRMAQSARMQLVLFSIVATVLAMFMALITARAIGAPLAAMVQAWTESSVRLRGGLEELEDCVRRGAEQAYVLECLGQLKAEAAGMEDAATMLVAAIGNKRERERARPSVHQLEDTR